ncbi:MAG: hypothetical protein J7503_17160, partial [Cellulomonas iranensis]|nr:hypothetical protein [Cellulomonas iranensis]
MYVVTVRVAPVDGTVGVAPDVVRAAPRAPSRGVASAARAGRDPGPLAARPDPPAAARPSAGPGRATGRAARVGVVSG